jgi:hypothetical protein
MKQNIFPISGRIVSITPAANNFFYQGVKDCQGTGYSPTLQRDFKTKCKTSLPPCPGYFTLRVNKEDLSVGLRIFSPMGRNIFSLKDSWKPSENCRWKFKFAQDVWARLAHKSLIASSAKEIFTGTHSLSYNQGLGGGGDLKLLKALDLPFYVLSAKLLR